jgi:hypothetical protein
MEYVIVFIAMFIIMFIFIGRKKKQQNQPEYTNADNDDIFKNFPTEALYHLKQAQDSELKNDFLGARVGYMACVDLLKRYKSATPQLEFAKNEYAQFVRRDPIFNKMLPFFLEGVRQNQGILQSDITAKAEDMDWGELKKYNRSISKDDIRYVFYFAEEFGLLIRKKEGRSYRLYLPEQLKDATE